jgi:hypothetical protein
MALIIDPDSLTYEVANTPTGTYMLTVATSGSLIYLTEVGALDSDGVNLQTVYSKLKEIWLIENLPFDFPMESIYDESFEFINGWRPGNDATRSLYRSAGWAERNGGNTVVREYANITTLGSFGASEQAYFSNQSGVASDFTFTGPVNEGVQIYGGSLDGNFNRRSSFSAFLRIQGKTYDSYDLLTAQNLSALTYKKYGVPLSNSGDLHINETDNDIDTTSPFTGMSVTYYATPQTISGTLAGGNYDFGVIIDANGGTAQEVYNWMQRQLRKTGDIDADASTLIGKLADDILEYVGDTLYTRSTTNPDGGGTGVFIENLDANSLNSVFFTDNTAATRNYPFVAAGTIVFNQNLIDDADAEYYMYFADSYGTTGAITVEDNNAADIAGNISGAPSISFSFAYDTNNQGGRTPGTDADVVVVASGKSTAKFVKATYTITRSTGQNISLVSALERSYLNN